MDGEVFSRPCDLYASSRYQDGVFNALSTINTNIAFLNMRLSASQIKTILETASLNFGIDTKVWLFGSRIDDRAKGGDIDLYIEVIEQTPAKLIACKLKFLRDLHKKIGDQKIDVVLNRVSHSANLPIYQIAKQTGIQLQ